MSETSEQTIAWLQQKIKDLELQLKKAKDNSGYWLKREEKPEIFEERAQNALPVLKEDKNLLIDNKSDLDHIIIEWDNYHALSALNYTHKWKIDVIYIDPPYNTWNKDFIYNDDYVDPEDTYRHSKWISFMSKRLKLAKNLLTDEGVIFISIDDNEQANLKLLCDEIFWENSFINNFMWLHWKWKKNKQSRTLQQYCIAYWKRNRNDLPERSMIRKAQWKFSNPDCDPRWDRFSGSISFSEERSNKKSDKYFEIVSPSWIQWKRQRMCTKEEMDAYLADNRIYFGSAPEYSNTPRLKIFPDDENELIPDNLLDNCWTTRKAQKDLDKIIDTTTNEKGKIVPKFDNPKPPELISHLINITNKNDNITILDFFAWSWTTWHAVLDLNKQDWWHRKFILCSNRENTSENPDKNICKDITYERVKKVMQWYTNSKWENIEWLGWWNLRYYTTEFIQNKKSTDDLRQGFIYLCDELLCIKEDTFYEYKSVFLSDKLKCYHKNNHYTVILYDIREMEKLQNLLSNIGGEISVYIFSLSWDSCEEELQQFSNKITIENIPDDILETYKKIF